MTLHCLSRYSAFPYVIAAALLFAHGQLPAQIVINEIMADNGGGYRDEDGESPDWIELHNAGANTIDLSGWHLTDNPDQPALWTFPATNLPSGGYLLVFASGKDRSVAGAPLHTNFRLSTEGEYLGLTRPDSTVAYAFAPVYPAQTMNVSFGIERQVVVTPLVFAPAPTRFLVPGSSAFESTWFLPSFADGGWPEGAIGLGFERGTQQATNQLGQRVLALDFDDDDAGETGQANTETGFDQMLLGANPAVFGNLTVTLSALGNGSLDDRDRTTPVETGLLSQDQLYDDFVFVNGQVNGDGMAIEIAGLPPGRQYEVRIWSFDSGSIGTRVSDWVEAASGTVLILTNGYAFDGASLPEGDSARTLTAAVQASASGQLRIEARRSGGTSHGVFLNALTLTELGFRPLITTDIENQMHDRNASAWARIPFVAADVAELTSLTLRMRYDDGFVAWLNGERVAEAAAPTTLEWNSQAAVIGGPTGSPQEATFSLPLDLVIPGTNLLAIHGLNASANDADFLLLPELTGEAANQGLLRFFVEPNPGLPNGSGVLGVVASPHFSVSRGYYDAPFAVTLTAPESGAAIFWTTNGSTPSPSNGFPYSTPVPITGTLALRAAAFRTNYAPSCVVTHSYIFPAQVLQQPASLPGYPATWQAGYPADYAMDPAVVGHPRYGATLRQDLLSLPALFLVGGHDDLWGSVRGIYNHATSDTVLWERPGSVELVLPSGDTAFTVNCGLRMHGNASRDNVRTPKHSFRLLFKSTYGPPELDYAWFPGSPVTRFDTLILRACFTDSWATRHSPGDTSIAVGERYRPEDALYLRDIWVRDSFLAMGHLVSRSSHSHLYLNGLYWGLYDVAERQDASFFSHHLGGPEEAWDVMRDFSEVLDGSKADWNALIRLCNAGITNEAAYQAVRAQVDVPNLIDFMLLHFFGEAEDWPHHNWYAAHRRATNSLPATSWIFLPWDQEITLDQDYARNRLDVSNDDTPARIYSKLRSWPEFRREFGDRAQKHLFNSGALTVANNQLRLALRANSISNALVAESARWGDAREFDTPGNPGTGKTFTRDEYWVPELLGLLTNWFPRQQEVLLSRLRTAALFPSLGAPELSTFGGRVPFDYEVTLTHTNAAGTIYYTLDGSDPRVYGSGGVAPGAKVYAAPIQLQNSGPVLARVRNGSEWSARVETHFDVIPPPGALQITELYYSPAPEPGIDEEEFEFLELRNAGVTTLSLSGYHFTNGITFTFPPGTQLASGATIVLVRNPVAFTNRFPGAPWLGDYSGRLDNSGEPLTLCDAAGEPVVSFAYGVAWPWPLPHATNSIQRLNLATQPDAPAGWVAFRPTPGTGLPTDWADAESDGLPLWFELEHGFDPTLAEGHLDSDADGLSNALEFRAGTDPRVAENFDRLAVRVGTAGAAEVILDFYGLPARTYVIEQSATLAPPSWNPALSLPPASEPQRYTVTNAALAAPLFYRLRFTP